MTKDDRHFEKHIQERSEDPPEILYKYVGIEAARAILLSRKFRFRSPLYYNDPFDTQWNIMWPLFTEEAKEYEQQLLANAIRDPGSWSTDIDLEFRKALYPVWNRIQRLSEDQREVAIADFVKDATEGDSLPENQAQHIRSIQQRLRVHCLSESHRSVLMWSHYADQHQGLVLGFDSGILENGLKRPLEPIKYCSEMPRLVDYKPWVRAILFGLPTSDLIEQGRGWALTKHSDWEYEKEWRFVTVAKKGTLGEYEDFPFPCDALVEIVIGCRTKEAHSAELLTLARELSPSIRHFQMREHTSRFQLTKTEIDS